MARAAATLPDLDLNHLEQGPPAGPDHHEEAHGAASHGGGAAEHSGHGTAGHGGGAAGHGQPGSSQEHGDAAHAHAHGKHKGHGGHGGHAGGHGGNWLVTYCDMITLLIAFFICILTFASKENGKQSNPKLRDSVIYGPGGTGAIGPKGANSDSIVWRQVLASANPQMMGSRSAPRYSDPQMTANEQVLDLLDHSTETALDDSFSMRVPLVVIMKDAKTLSPAGHRLLSNIAFALRQFPFDLIVQIEDRETFGTAFHLAKHLTELAGVHPSRAGVSLDETGPRRKDGVRFMFVARQK
jgi:chemotaxis protein MotB